MALQFKKAVKHKLKARVALDGPAGAGKTMSALKIASALVPGGRIAVIDTERASASRYANLFDFDVLELETFSPQLYVEAIQAAVRHKYDVIIVDSLSHAWSGKDGALDKVDGKFGGWRNVTPMHNALVDALLTAPAHVFVTMRTKTEYLVTEEDNGNGRKKQKVERIGLKPIQRDGTEYEFDVVGDMNLDNLLSISKTRCPALKGRTFLCPGEDVAKILGSWLEDGETQAEEPKPTPMPAREIAKAAANVAVAANGALEADLLAEQVRKAFDAAKTLADVEAAGALGAGLDAARKRALMPARSAAMARVSAQAEQGAA